MIIYQLVNFMLTIKHFFLSFFYTNHSFSIEDSVAFIITDWHGRFHDAEFIFEFGDGVVIMFAIVGFLCEIWLFISKNKLTNDKKIKKQI